MKFVILGEPCSKANSRTMIFKSGHKPRCIKSKKALNYVDSFIFQTLAMGLHTERDNIIPTPLIGNLALHCKIYYASLRPDLDESLVMDCLQKSGVLKNDRQIKEKHIYHGVDKNNPRCELEIILLDKKDNGKFIDVGTEKNL